MVSYAALKSMNLKSLHYRVCTVPIEDGLNRHTFNYNEPEDSTGAIFDWQLNFYKVPVLPEDQADPSKPLHS
jgi:hypothetical protein